MGRRSTSRASTRMPMNTPPEAVLPLLRYLTQERGSSSRAAARALLQPPCRLMDTSASTLVTSLPAPQASSSAMHWTSSAVMFSPPT